MRRKLLLRHVYAFSGAIVLCSFVFVRASKEIELEKNELAYSDTKIRLNFGGIEELIPLDESKCFRTDIYLSDIDLNNAGIESREQIVLQLRNFMHSKGFVNGNYSVANETFEGNSMVQANLLSLNGRVSDVEVISGAVEYEGQYPQVHVTFDLNLSNGKSLRGSYFKEMETFKYFF